MPRLAARWSLAADGEPVVVAVGRGRLWLARAAVPGGDGYGRLDRLDPGTGAPHGSWRTGGQPVAVAAGSSIWVANGSGSGVALPDTVVEFDADGHQVHSYTVQNPVAIAVDVDGAWVATAQGDQATVRQLRAGASASAVTLPGQAIGGTVPLVRCADAVYAATADDPSTNRTLLLRIGFAGTVDRAGTLPGRGPVTLACQPDGLLATLTGDTTRLAFVRNGSPEPVTVVLPVRKAAIQAADGYAWLLTDSPTPDHASVYLVAGASLRRSVPLDLPGDAVSFAADGRRLWTIQANVPGTTTEFIDVLEY